MIPFLKADERLWWPRKCHYYSRQRSLCWVFPNTLSWMVNHYILTMPHILSQGHKSQA